MGLERGQWVREVEGPHEVALRDQQRMSIERVLCNIAGICKLQIGGHIRGNVRRTITVCTLTLQHRSVYEGTAKTGFLIEDLFRNMEDDGTSLERQSLLVKYTWNKLGQLIVVTSQTLAAAMLAKSPSDLCTTVSPQIQKQSRRIQSEQGQ